MPHIVYCWKPFINVVLYAAYTELLYPRFTARMQYLCKRAFWVPLKECLITLHILKIMTHVISHWKAFINTFPHVTHAVLMYPQFLAHMQYFCRHGLTHL